MNNPSSIWDRPATNKELDQFYGREVTQAEINDAIVRQAAAFDADDLAEIVAENAVNILAYMQYGYIWLIGHRLIEARKEIIDRRASIELYGKPGIIKASEVTE